MAHFHSPDCRFYIYTLTDPRDGSVRYVGMTHRPEGREKQHLCAASTTPMGAWMNDLAAAGVRPSLTIIEEVNGFYAARRVEQKWIKHYAEIGTLLNRKAGRKSKRWDNCPEAAQ